MRKVATKTRNPNLFSMMVERDPVTGKFSILGHKAKRLVMKNQYQGEWETVSPRELAMSMRRDGVVAS